MENKSLKIIIGLLLVALAAGGVVVFYQWRTINLFKNQIISGGQSSLQSSSGTTEPGAPAYAAEAVKKTILESVKDVSGKVMAVSGKTLTIEADIIDFSKLPGLSEEELVKPIDSFPKAKKTYQILTDDKTKFAGKSLNMLSAGDEVKVLTNELVYQAGDLTAATIVSSGLSKDSLNVTETIGGAVKEIGDKSLTIEVSFIDYSKVSDVKNVDPRSAPKIQKTYKVLVDDKTEFPDKKLKDIKTGDLVQVSADNNIFDASEFTAVKIVFPVPTAPK